MINKLLEKILRPLIKSEEDRAKLSTVIIPSFLVRSGYFILAYLILLVLTRTLGPRRYGIYSFTAAIIFLLTNLSSYGFEVLALKYTASYLSKHQTSLWKGLYKWASRALLLTSFSVTAATALFIWLAAFKFNIIPKTSYTLPILASCSVIPLYTFINFYSNILRGQRKLLLSFLPDNTIKPLFLLISLLALRLCLGSMSLHLAIELNIISFFVAFSFTFLLFHKINHFKDIQPQYDKSVWKKFVASLFVLTCISTISTRFDMIMLGSLKDAEQVGIYYAAERIGNSLLFFLYVMNTIIAPSIAGFSATGDTQKLQIMITRTIRWVMLFSLPIFITIVAFSSQIMQLSGPQFLPGKTALIIICLAQLVDIAFGPTGNFALMAGHEKYSALYMLIGIFINFALNLLLTPHMGFNGTAIANSCSLIFWNAALFLTIKKKTGIRTWIFG